jgi:hypothetical protein
MCTPKQVHSHAHAIHIVCTCTCTYTCTHSCTPSTPIHVHRHVYAYTYTCPYMRIPMHMCTPIHIHVCAVFPLFNATVVPSEYYVYKTEEDASVRAAIRKAHALGLKVMCMPAHAHMPICKHTHARTCTCTHGHMILGSQGDDQASLYLYLEP